jgi:hypothetical protein
MGKCAFDVASYNSYSLPRPLIIAKNIVTSKDPNLTTPLQRKSSMGLLLTNGPSSPNQSPSPNPGASGGMVLARGNSGLSRANSGLSRANSGLKRDNSNVGLLSSGSDRGGDGDGGYEYDPGALGIVTKRAWDEQLDLAYEEEKPKNNRMKRPGAALGGNVIIKVGGDNPTGGSRPGSRASLNRQGSKTGGMSSSPAPMSRQGSKKAGRS